MSVRLRDLGVRFPRSPRPVLHGIDADLGAGESVLFLDPSGAGKSSLLRVLAGVIPSTIVASVTGDVQVCGHDPRITPVPQLAARVATLTQDPADQLCLPTVFDEVAFALENRAVPRSEMAPRVRAALASVGAGHLADRRTHELSGGESQRGGARSRMGGRAGTDVA